METTTEIRVTETDVDYLGHVNNSVYVNYLEKGRVHWYTQHGLPIDEMISRNVGTVVLKLEILYAKEARLGETLKVKTTPIKIGTKSFMFQQNIYNEKGEIITEATVTNVMFDLLERKGIVVAPEIRKAFEEMKEPQIKG
ncbi:acyl-CoA thioesterase [Bacillus sp. B15-48]|uniref:acyl-CoA thioesterase n=1 Tax=Bacillus sp. B15-48 TaxID=1548601 RepID=UPI0019400E31|nr:acyl-CoA thioesterase [Bacillus sp. B15-48]